MKAKYGLPQEVKYCTKCVNSNQKVTMSVATQDSKDGKKPTVDFDENNVCYPCRFHEEMDKKINWSERETELKQLLNKYRSSDGSYDCIVPGSGGKDSVYQSLILKEKYGMNPLTVTWSPHIYTDVGKRNHERWLSNGGLDNFLFTPSGDTLRKLTKLAYTNLLHPFQPFVLGQRNYVVHMAKLLGIKLVFFGENPAQYGGYVGEGDSPIADEKYFTEDNIDGMLISGETLNDLSDKHSISRNDLKYFLPHTRSNFRELNLDIHWLGYYLKFHPQTNYYYAKEKIGFELNDQRTEGSYSRYNSLDDKLDGMHYWTGFIKFGIGRATHEASQEVRNGDITRDEAVALVRRFDGEFPKRYFNDILEFIDISEKEFFDVADSFRSPHLWDYIDGEWSLKYQVK